MDPIKKMPISRVNKFYDESEFRLEIDLGREYVEGDINFTIILYRVDRTKTMVDDLYGENYIEELRYLPPVELRVMIELDDNEIKAYAPNGSISYKDIGNMTFHIYEDQLVEKGVDITYGDFIGYALDETTFKYWTVADDDRLFQTHEKSLKGYKPFFRTIKCVPVDVEEFRGI